MNGTASLALPASLVLSSPVLWMLHDGTMTAGDALRRWAICLAVCWVAIGLVRTLVVPASAGPASAPLALSAPAGDAGSAPQPLRATGEATGEATGTNTTGARDDS
ncbi:hypothetical protein D9V37_12735 [Nocardioides mangrovicus]|uniref:Uncharacterized protein n=1 Tax=Nocardioides mangrovicus TaxID=2478913 RepID=A0A3L8P340_9ACTN|nr:hypothetical protein [Nocardioides mangrovicus]RLV49392.1 hypothetical protein D9V37_12735 [Nocardioides mangrovicus]